MKYSTIVADPPWQYDEFCQIHSKAGRVTKPLPYQSMSLADIKALPVASFAEKDCRLFLWTTNKYLPDAFDVLKAWKFEYKQTIVWHKKGNPSPWGGSVAPNHAEYLLVAVRGNPPRKDMLKTNVFAINVKRHSKKPDAFIDYIEMVSDPPYLEMFSRAARLGWHVWGNEVESNVDLTPPNTRCTGREERAPVS